MCSPGCSGTLFLDQDVLELTEMILGLKACAAATTGSNVVS